MSRAAVVPGETLRVEGFGFRSGAPVTISIRAERALDVLAVVRASEGGRVAASVEVPPGTPGGQAVLEARGRGPDGGLVVLGAMLGVTTIGGSGAGRRDPLRRPHPGTGATAFVAALAGFALAVAWATLSRTARKPGF